MEEADIVEAEPTTSVEEDRIVAPHELSPHGEPCSACGCPVEPNDRFCPACGTPRSVAASPEVAEPSTGVPSTRGARPPIAAPITAEIVPGQPSAAPAAAAEEHKYFRCRNCGSEMSADPDQRSYVCPFCDSTYVVEFSPEWINRHPPEFVIGFAVTREQAQEKFHLWLKENPWFRPGDLVSASVAEKQKGVYLPFWSFSMLAESTWRATIGEYWYRTETYTTRDSKGRTVTRTRQVRETEWWPLAGRHHRYYSGHLISASKGLPQEVAEQIMPFNLPALKRYQPYFLAGWLCEEYSVERDAALARCRDEFQRREHLHIGNFLPGNTHRNLEVSTQFSKVNSDLCLLPIHLLSYRYRNKLYRFLVNGQTGKYGGDKPVSWPRIGAAIAAGVLLVAVIVIVILVLTRSAA
ncbi:MAG: zinc ribbon domain-containing protein [Pirellulaceae bacterium]